MYSPEIIARVKSAVDIVELVGRSVELKKSGHNWMGLCPFHNEKTASFSVNPEKQLFHCFGCGQGGDVIGFLVRTQGVNFVDAVKTLADQGGVTLPTGHQGKSHHSHAAPAPQRPARSTPGDPAPRMVPPDAGTRWREKAGALVADAHDAILADDRFLRWFRRRGIRAKSIRAHWIGAHLGEKGKDKWRHRATWGLPDEFKADGRKKRLWIPRGFVIPCFNPAGRLVRIRIRRNDDKIKYYVIPGSSTATWAMLSGKKGIVVVESELDGILIHQEAGDRVDVIALGSSSTRPDARSMAALKSAACILLIPDLDRAGFAAAKWWAVNFEKATIYPSPLGKDPGDAFKAGLNIRNWICAGLPAGWTLGRSLLIDKGRGAAKNLIKQGGKG